MSEALVLARQKRQAMKQLGVLPNKSVKFSGNEKLTVTVGIPGGTESQSITETELIKLAARRAGAKGMTDYVRKVVLAQAAVDAGKPMAERKEKTLEELNAEIAKLQARVAAKQG